MIASLDGVGEVLEGESLAAAGLAHERSGELVVLAERDAWFTYHYWLDNAHAPDFGRQVEIHRKPGYDPAELFFDPDDEKGAKLRGGIALARKKTGMRYVLSRRGDGRVQAREGHPRAAARGRSGRAGVHVERASFARDRVAAVDVRTCCWISRACARARALNGQLLTRPARRMSNALACAVLGLGSGGRICTCRARPGYGARSGRLAPRCARLWRATPDRDVRRVRRR